MAAHVSSFASSGSSRTESEWRRPRRGRLEMAKLVRVAHDVDGRDLVAGELERGRLEHATWLDRHEARQAVDEAVAEQLRWALGKESGQLGVALDDVLDAEDLVCGCRRVSSAVGGGGDVCGQELAQPLKVAIAGRG